MRKSVEIPMDALDLLVVTGIVHVFRHEGQIELAPH